jgi:hypothetical protein
MRLLWIAPLVVAGCAQVPASEVASIDLCRYMLRGGRDAVVAEAEAHRRGFDCAPYMGTLAAQSEARNRAMMDAARYFNPPPAPTRQLPMPQQPLNCRSYTMGGTLYTNCQ